MKSFLSLLCLFVASAVTNNVAVADEPAKHNCIQPEVPGKFASEQRLKEINKKTAIYKECINKFAREQQEISSNSVDVAKANAAHDAGEAAIQEFNEYMKLRNKGHDED